ncbi:MAG: hypothetical protein C5B51_10555 [Terriglobia bacterium]|nr:MAG: hypothetical protein C5B51_10555 [Terriglobia bacterium]
MTGKHEYLLAQDAFSKRYIPECLQFLRSAESHGYPSDECASCRWNCWMLLGRFEDAWLESDAIAARNGPDPNCLWDGRPFRGNRVIIRCLHGFGDAIQFLRYTGLVRRAAQAVFVQTHPQLRTLARALPHVDGVTSWEDGPGRHGSDWDQQIEVMELPRAFRTTLVTIPTEIPYISPPGPYIERSRYALGPRSKRRIGLLWEGSNWNSARNVPAPELLPILATPGVEFYSFQRGTGREQLGLLCRQTDIRDLSGDSPDVAYLAADLMQMDLLISVDTMAAHLAGALGRPVWMLLPYEADWRWMLRRRDTPWYPSMTLFRQKTPGDWRHPVHEIARDLGNTAFRD